jgi:hypothetical protein
MGYVYRGTKVLNARELLDVAKAQADDIIAAVKRQAIEEARIIYELAYDQAMAMADRDYASREEKAEDRAKAKAAIMNRVGRQRLTAAAIDVANGSVVNIKAADRLENIEYLIGQGCSVDEAINRSGYSSFSSFERAAYRHGRRDLVQYAKDKMAA